MQTCSWLTVFRATEQLSSLSGVSNGITWGWGRLATQSSA